MPWGMLANDEALEELDMRNWDMTNFTQTNLMGRMLGGSSYALAGGDYGYRYKLKKVDFSNCIFPNAEGIFQYMPSVEEIILENVDTSNIVNMRGMFASDYSLKSLVISSSIFFPSKYGFFLFFVSRLKFF